MKKTWQLKRSAAFCLTVFPLVWLVSSSRLAAEDVALPTRSSATAQSVVGEKIPSEDDLIKDLHSLGLLEGRTNIFRCACPVRDLAKKMSSTQPTDDDLRQAKIRMQRLYDLGVRTDISFQDPDSSTGEDAKTHDVERAVALESAAASAVGIRFISRPIDNSGDHSLQTMTDDEVFDLVTRIAQEILDDSKTGGVAYHCTAGHDRTGIISAFIRMKYQHWPVDQAIAEMRQLGHNWPKFSANGGISSWHEDHLRAIAIKLQVQDSGKPAVP
jgi:hypothetical protein